MTCAMGKQGYNRIAIEIHTQEKSGQEGFGGIIAYVPSTVLNPCVDSVHDI